MGIGTIYLIRNKRNGKGYVGQTIRSLTKRWQCHLGASDTVLARAIKKYGADAFNISALQTAERAELDKLEQEWIERLGTLLPDGYNMTAGGFGGTRTEMAKRKIAAGSKRRWSDEEFRRRVVSAQKKAWKSGKRSRTKSEASRAKMAAKAREHWNDPIVRERMLKARQGDSAKRGAEIASTVKRLWANPEYRKRQLEAIRNGQAASRNKDGGAAHRKATSEGTKAWWKKRKEVRHRTG